MVRSLVGLTMSIPAVVAAAVPGGDRASLLPASGNYAPEPRAHHVAVWTGTEMIVWGGGLDTLGFLDTGGRYDAGTDTWLSMDADAWRPAGRSKATAVWTGSEMIVWGGYAGSSTTATGGRYDPATDLWRPTTNVGRPAARASHTAVWTGAEMIVWGGTTSPDGGRYDPATDSWRPTSTVGVPPPRRGHSAVWTGSRMVVWGGFDGSATLNTGGRYDPLTDSWTPTATAGAPLDRTEHTAVWTGQRMLVWGGQRTPTGTPREGSSYDPQADTWQALPVTGSPDGQYGHTAVWTGSEMIIWGQTGLDVGGAYRPSTGTWRRLSTTGQPRDTRWHTAVWTGSEMIVWGGNRTSGLDHTSLGGRYDPATDTWRTTALGPPETPQPRWRHTMVSTGNGAIVWGGGFSSGAVYDPLTDRWQPMATLGAPTARIGNTAVWTGTELIVWGGYPAGATDTGGVYDPAANAWRPTSTGSGVPAARGGHTAVWSGTEMIVWGGIATTNNVEYGDGGRYDPAADRWTTIPVSPVMVRRTGHVAAWTGTEMIVWGGCYDTFGSTTCLATGGRYVPATGAWTPMSTGPGAPPGGYHRQALWTGTGMIVWRGPYDGGSTYSPASDTWRPISTVGVPVFSHGIGDAYSQAWSGTEMIVWGGDSTQVTRARGGAYDPATDSWRSLRTLDSPGNRLYPAAAMVGGEMLVWGGDLYGLCGSGGRYDPSRNVWSYGPRQACSAPDVAPSELPKGFAGVPYSFMLTGQGGVPPYSFSIGSGQLPTWASLSASGILSGTPSGPGIWEVVVAISDAAGCAGRRGYRLVICAPMSTSPATLPDGATSTYYAQSLSATGGTPPYELRLTSGALPTDMELQGSTIVGTAGPPGIATFTIGSTDAGGCTGSTVHTLRVCGQLEVNPRTLPVGSVGRPFSVQLATSYGVPAYTYMVASGTLPPGLALSASGVLSGTPSSAGTFSFAVRSIDALGCLVNKSYAALVAPASCGAIVVSPPFLPIAHPPAPYSVTLTAVGGVPPYTWTAVSLPGGFSLSPSGVLSGAATYGASDPFTVTAVDAVGCSGVLDYILQAGGNYVVGLGHGDPNPNRVRVLRADGSLGPVDFYAYGASHWGVNVAAEDVDGAWHEILTGPGPGAQYGPTVRAFRRDASSVAKVAFYAYGTLRYGVNVTGGDADGDAFGEILTGPGPGVVFGPHVRGWNYDGAVLSTIAKINFFAYGTLRYGVNVGGGDVEADGFHEILTGAGPSAAFAPLVRGFDYDGTAVVAIGKINFWAFPPPQYGAFVAGGDVDGDGAGEIGAAPGPGPTASHPVRFRAFDADSAVALVPGFDVISFPTFFGGRLGLGDVAGAARDDLVAAPGPDPTADATIRGYSYGPSGLSTLSTTSAFYGWRYGATTAAGYFGQ